MRCDTPDLNINSVSVLRAGIYIRQTTSNLINLPGNQDGEYVNYGEHPDGRRLSTSSQGMIACWEI